MADGTVPQFQIGARDDLVEVRLIGVPLDHHRDSAEHLDELRREFRLLEVQQAEDHDVPRRLLQLITRLEDRFATLVDSTGDDLDDAMDAGAATADLVYRVPPAAKAAVEALDALLDEADVFCRSGDTLLTLQTPPHALAYRKWYLGQFTAQLAGETPTPWQGS